MCVSCSNSWCAHVGMYVYMHFPIRIYYTWWCIRAYTRIHNTHINICTPRYTGLHEMLTGGKGNTHFIYTHVPGPSEVYLRVKIPGFGPPRWAGPLLREWWPRKTGCPAEDGGLLNRVGPRAQEPSSQPSPSASTRLWSSHSPASIVTFGVDDSQERQVVCVKGWQDSLTHRTPTAGWLRSWDGCLP